MWYWTNGGLTMHIIGRYLLILNTQHDSDNVHSPLTPLSVWMSLSRQSTALNRLAPFSTRSTRAAVSSDWSVPLRMRANTWYHKHTFSPRECLSLALATRQSWWDKASILERLAPMFSLMLCTVHSSTTLLVTTRTDAISVRMESVWTVSSLREDDLRGEIL